MLFIPFPVMEVGFFDYLCNQLLFSKIVTMILVRELIYKDKTLDDFNIDSDESIFKLFFDIILKIEGFNADNINIEECVTIMFNDACFLFNAITRIKRPYLHYSYLRELIHTSTYCSMHLILINSLYVDIVFCMVYYLLKKSRLNNPDFERFMSVIVSNVKGHGENGKTIIGDFYNTFDCTLESFSTDKYLEKISITEDNLNKVNWFQISNGYSKTKLKEIVSFWEEPHERNLIIDDIKAEVENNSTYLNSSIEIIENDLPF